MSIFDELKTLTFPHEAGTGGGEQRVSFAEKEGRFYVLFSDLWRLCRMTGDQEATMGVYVRSRGSSAPRHFIFKASSPPDALVSREVAARMVTDWCGDSEDTIFHRCPVDTMFREVRRAAHGLDLIKSIFEAAPPAGQTSGFDVVAMRLEVDLIARAMLSNWGRPASGFPALDKSAARFLTNLTLSANDAHRTRKVHVMAQRFFHSYANDVFDRIRPERLHLAT